MTTSNKPELVRPRNAGSPGRCARAALLAAVAIVIFTGPSAGAGADNPRNHLQGGQGRLKSPKSRAAAIEARNRQLKSEVQGVTKILYIVEEGYLVTPRMWAEGKVWWNSIQNLLDHLTEQELQYQNLASFTEARRSTDRDQPEPERHKDAGWPQVRPDGSEEVPRRRHRHGYCAPRRGERRRERPARQ